MIEVKSLRKTFGAVVSVDCVSFQVLPGEVFGLLGPNGAGKTTTLRMLATLLKPSSGTASVCGLTLDGDPISIRRKLGYVSGDLSLYHRFTVREVLDYFGEIFGLSTQARAARLKLLVERFGLREFIDRRIDKLSTGMRQRASLARAVIHDPDVLILDEPSSGLDAVAAHGVDQFIRECRDSGRTILYSTHILEEAEYLCDRIAVIDNGRIRASGTMAELRALSGHDRLREVFLSLLGSAPAAEVRP